MCFFRQVLHEAIECCPRLRKSAMESKQDVFLKRKFEDETVTVHFSIANFNEEMEGEDDMDAAMGDEEDMDTQSHGGNTKGAINQGPTGSRNFKVAPEDSSAPADREELQDEVCSFPQRRKLF